MKRTGYLALLLALVAAGPARAADTIKIGLMAPLTGSWASEGQEMKRNVDLLAAEVNANGGVLGKQVEVVLEDDGGDPRTASLAAQRLTTKGVVAVIGTYGSAVTEATQGIYDEAGIVQVANGSTAVRLTEKGLKHFFRTCPRDDEQGRVGAATLEKMGAKKIALLHDNSAYSKGLADEINTLLKAKKANVVFFDALTPKEQDYSAILTKLKAAGPDVVFFTGYYPEAGLLLKQKKQMGWNVPFIGGDAINNPDLVKIAGKEAAEGFQFLSPPVPKDLDTPASKAFIAAYQKKYGEPPASIYGVLAGDGFRVITAAIAGAKSTKADAIAAFLVNGLKDFPGFTGRIAFNAKGDRVGELYRVYKVDKAGRVRAPEVSVVPGGPLAAARPLSSSRDARLMEQFLQQLTNGLAVGGIYALIALGYTMVYGVLKLINFAHGDLFTYGGYLGMTLLVSLLLQGRLGAVAGVVVLALMVMGLVGLMGVILERAAYRPLRESSRLSAVVSALGASIFLQNALMLIYGARVQVYPEGILPEVSVRLFTLEIPLLRIIVVVTSVVMMTLLYLFVQKTKTGTAIRAAAIDQGAARLMGIDVNRVIRIVFFIGPALGGAAGLLVGLYYGQVNFTMGWIYGMKAFTAAILGGIGNIPGAMVGGLLLGVIEALGAAYLSIAWKDAIAFCVLILILIVRPTGLLGERVAEKV